jgi:hypothetical protein
MFACDFGYIDGGNRLTGVKTDSNGKAGIIMLSSSRGTAVITAWIDTDGDHVADTGELKDTSTITWTNPVTPNPVTTPGESYVPQDSYKGGAATPEQVSSAIDQDPALLSDSPAAARVISYVRQRQPTVAPAGASPATGSSPQPVVTAVQGSTTRSPAPKRPGEDLPKLGINSFILFGGTATVTSSIRRFGDPRDFDLMLKTLIKGIAVFTVVIGIWIVVTLF